mgnify:CR=1 FL=1
MRALRKRLQQPHPWWHQLPPERRSTKEALRLQARRLKAWLVLRPQRIAATIIFYVLLCALPTLLGLPMLGVVALMPLALAPPVAYLLYWLVWKDYHH